jgi:hypothetical protein
MVHRDGRRKARIGGRAEAEKWGVRGMGNTYQGFFKAMDILYFPLTGEIPDVPTAASRPRAWGPNGGIEGLFRTLQDLKTAFREGVATLPGQEAAPLL